ncbi:MAG TPA: cation diffusion facilitator family transporter [Stellaceae bacterium]|nr:cation diffusion facilitator family transporter [Stellaceae bacterium]
MAPTHSGHDHHGHGHSHTLANELGIAFALSIALNLGFVAIEVAFGFIGHSMALLADAGHNFSDVLGLAAAWTANVLSTRRPSARYTYGLRSSSILAALLNAIILLIAVGGIVVEAVQRLLAPAPVGGGTIVAVACAGIVVNGAAALLLGRSHHGDLNVKSAFAHMLGDTAVSVGVAAAGAVILLTGWLWLDPAASIVISLVIVLGTWRLLRHALDLALQAVPPEIDPGAVRAHLARIDGVGDVHDLHIWPMSTTATALTCHLVMPGGHPGDAVLAGVAATLQQRFGIEHATIQVETGDPAHPCVLVPDHVV